MALLLLRCCCCCCYYCCCFGFQIHRNGRSARVSPTDWHTTRGKSKATLDTLLRIYLSRTLHEQRTKTSEEGRNSLSTPHTPCEFRPRRLDDHLIAQRNELRLIAQMQLHVANHQTARELLVQSVVKGAKTLDLLRRKSERSAGKLQPRQAIERREVAQLAALQSSQVQIVHPVVCA